MRCHNCAFENRSGVKFCERCGEKISIPQSLATKNSEKCSNCEFVNKEGVLFCERCGNKLRTSPNNSQNTPPKPRIEENRSTAPNPRNKAWFWYVFGFVGISFLLIAFSIKGLLSKQNRTDLTGFSSPPTKSLDEVQEILADDAIVNDPNFYPWDGFEIYADDEVYIYGEESWRSITKNGEMWGNSSSQVEIRESANTLRIISDDPLAVTKIAELLENNAGVSSNNGEYKITDHKLYRDGIIEKADEQGLVLTGESEPNVTLMVPNTTPITWVEPADDHVWMIDDTAAILLVPGGEELTVAGRFVPDILRGAVWQPAPNTELLHGSVQQILSEIDGIKDEGGKKTIPFKVFVQSDAEPIRVDKIPTGKGPSVSIRVYEPPKDKCRFFDCIRKKVSDVSTDIGTGTVNGVKKGWNTTVNMTEATLDKVDLEDLKCAYDINATTECALTVGGYVYDKTISKWVPNVNIFIEKNCRTAGPNPPPGNGVRNYPVTGYTMQGFQTSLTSDWQERLDLARNWIPPIEPSRDEQCGEITRVFANVHPYKKDGSKANSLSEASYVEIVYTIFLKEDGGRFKLHSHPGDNEGFVIGLARTEAKNGLCDTGFEFVGGRTVSHSDKGGALVLYFEINKRQIDDFGPSDIGTNCPTPDPTNKNTKWRILMSEGKHALYYHRAQCESALGPRLNVMIPKLLGIDSNRYSSSMFEYVLKVTPADIIEDLDTGMEECESGRDLIDLSSWIELYSEELYSVYGNDLGFNDRYETENGVKTYAQQARGDWCFGKGIISAIEKRPDCNGNDYQVPYLLEADAVIPNKVVKVPTKQPTKPSPVIVMVTVPEVSKGDLTLDEADDLLQSNGLGRKVAGWIEVTSDLDGIVLDQLPAAGVSVEEGYFVEVWVGSYTPPEEVLVPDLYGETESTAYQIGEENDLIIEVAGEVPVSQSYVGLVVDQQPESGTISVGGTIRIWIGVPNVIRVPDLGGLNENDAINSINTNGFVPVYGGTISTTDQNQDDRVMDQEPSFGQNATAGSVITYWLGKAELTFPEKRRSDLVKISITDKHGSTHMIGEIVELCYSWVQQQVEPSDKWEIWDFQPAGSEGAIIKDGSMSYAGSDCMTTTITGPTGYEQIAIVDLKFDYATNSWKIRDWADVWIYVK